MGVLGELVVKILGDATNLNKSLTDSEKKFKQLSTNLDKMGKKMVSAGRKLTMFATLPIIAVGAAALKAAADFEKQTIAFEVMMGNAEDAHKLLKEIEQFAATTPFQLPGITEGAKRLLAFGSAANNIIPQMRDLGNLAMGDAAKLDSLVMAFGKVQARGKASMRELNMFMYAGVPILDALAKQFDVSTEKLYEYVSQGKVGFDDVNAAIQALSRGEGQFAGMIEKQSKSLAGLLSTLKDNVMLLGKAIAESVLPTIKKWVDSAIKLVQKWREMDERTKKMIITIALMVAAVGPLLLIAGKLMLAIKALLPVLAYAKAAMMAFNVALWANPIVLIITAVVALTAAIGALTVFIIKKRKAQKEANLEMLRAKANANAYRREVKKLSEEEELAATKKLLSMAKIKMATETSERVQEELLIQVAELTQREKELTKSIEENSEAYKTQQEQEKLATEATKDLNKELEDAERLGRIFGKTAKEVAEDKISILESAITDMVEKGVLPGNKALEDTIDLMRELGEEADETAEKIYASAIGSAAKQARRTQAAAGKEQQEGVKAHASAIGSRTKQREIEAEKAQEIYEDDLEHLRGLTDETYNAAGLEIAIETWKNKVIEDAAEEHAEKMKEKIRIVADFSASMLGYISDIWGNFYDGQMAMAEGNEEKEKQIARRRAVMNKTFAIFQAGINTALAITTALASVPFGRLKAVFAGLLGAAQITAIASKPLPALAAGGIYSGPTIVGEGGPEAAIPLTDDVLGRLGQAIAKAEKPINNIVNVEAPGMPSTINVTIDGQTFQGFITGAIRDRKILVDKGAVA